MTAWMLVIKLFVGDADTATTVLQREFPTEALCRQEAARGLRCPGSCQKADEHAA
jgi:hypothetical protein